MRHTTTAEVRLGEGKAASSGPARRATRRFGCHRDWLRSDFVAVEPPGTDNHLQRAGNPGNVGLAGVADLGRRLSISGASMFRPLPPISHAPLPPPSVINDPGGTLSRMIQRRSGTTWV